VLRLVIVELKHDPGDAIPLVDLFERHASIAAPESGARDHDRCAVIVTPKECEITDNRPGI
jgi:hypothetical protein